MSMDTRKPGRPSLSPGHPSAHVCVRLPAPMFDEAYRRAQEDRVTVSEWVRRGITRVLDHDRAIS